MANRPAIVLCRPQFHFAPSALGGVEDSTWAVGPGYYISRLWRWDLELDRDSTALGLILAYL